MSFYKNINCEIKKWEPDTYYPKGSIVNFDNMVGEVQSTYGLGFWNTIDCKKRCMLYRFCQKYIDKDEPGGGWSRTKCAPSFRDDEDSIYFKRISLNIEK